MKAKKKPVIIDYYPVDFKEGLVPNMMFWFDSFGDSMDDFLIIDGEDMKVKTLEGTSYIVSKDDMIIMGISNEFYPCKKDIFYKTYDIVE